jgi:hypothetical protein
MLSLEYSDESGNSVFILYVKPVKIKWIPIIMLYINPAIKYANNVFPSCHSRESGNPGNTMCYGFRLSPRIKSGVRPE